MAKPDCRTAMVQLIDQIRAAIPFDRPESQLCAGPCEGCSMKLLGYLEPELEQWEQRLQQGETPTLGDIAQLAKSARKIHRVLVKNGLLAVDEAERQQH